MILVAIGANLAGPWGEPRVACHRAVRELEALPGLRLLAVSGWYGSAAWPPSGQPDYVNGVARLECTESDTITPEGLLAALQRLEHAAGRVRTVANAARSLDLDLLVMDDLVRDAPDPVLPHPRLAERLFVLQPLHDVCPDWIHPRDGRSVEAMLQALRPDGVGDGCATAVPPLLWNIPQR